MTKILVIEDHAVIRKLIDQILQKENYEVVLAENGVMGLEIAEKEMPDLIICDVMMPDLDGYSVLRRLQENSTTNTIPFIFLTAKAEKRDMRLGMQLGADDYLTKPFSKDDLIGAVKARLERYHAVKETYQQQIQVTSSSLGGVTNDDTLTNLPSQLHLRELFNQLFNNLAVDVQETLTATDAYGKTKFDISSLIPVYCIGLDRFERVNENLGYEFGNLLIREISQRLKNCLDDKDILIHLNTGEFAIALQTPCSKQAATNFAQALLEQFSLPFALNNQEVFITLSIGISLYPRDDQDIGKLLQYSSKAMNRVKQQGGNQFQFYTVALNIGQSDLVALETDLRYALEREELQVYYQPQINLNSSKIAGVEALIRWFHPHRGLVPPKLFIPLAEETGLIEPIGEWVIDTACHQLKVWKDNGLNFLRLAVNLSARQFNQLNLYQKISRILIDAGLEPQDIELELTESTLVQNAEIALRRLQGLRSLGVRIAIDDFGTGYSSLSYLQQFPFDVLKIDQSFVRNIDKNAANTAIVKAMISMAHQLNLKVIAEGVETEEELAFLTEHQCDEIQGYLFSYAVSASEFERSPFVTSVIGDW